MHPDEDAKVRALFALAHPGWPEPRGPWYFAYPTLVVENEEGVLIGVTSCSVSRAPSPDLAAYGDRVLYGEDVIVHPDHRGRGHGWRLCEARLALGRQIGAALFLGMTWTANHAMRRIFEREGASRYQAIPRAYPQHPPPDDDGWLYVLPLRGARS